MLVDVIAVRPLDGYRLEVQFEDGVKGIVKVDELVEFKGVFEYLQDEKQFAQVSVDKEVGVVCWPNGADLDSEVLYSVVTGRPVPNYADMLSVGS